MVDEPRGDEGQDAGDVSGSEEPRPRLRELGHYIRTQRKSAQLSLRNLSKLAGVSNPYLSQIERGLRKPSAEILQAIAKALEISSETLYVKAGILEERSEHVDVESAIARDAHLTEQQRASLLEMYRAYTRLSQLQRDASASGRGEKGRGVVDQVIDAVGTGGVDDAAIAAASHAEEDADEA